MDVQLGVAQLQLKLLQLVCLPVTRIWRAGDERLQRTIMYSSTSGIAKASVGPESMSVQRDALSPGAWRQMHLRLRMGRASSILRGSGSHGVHIHSLATAVSAAAAAATSGR